MGRQRGLVHLTGQYGDVQLSFTAEGTPVAKFAPRQSGKRVKEAPNYGLTRKNNAEFTGSIYAARDLRRCFGERVRQFADRRLSSRLMQLTYSVLQRGQGPGGERSFEVGPNVGSFQHLEVNRQESLGGRFMAPFTVGVNTDRNTATLDVPAFNTDNYLSLPNGATHFKLLLVVGALSDFEFTGNENEIYRAVNPLLSGESSVLESALIPGVAQVTAPLQMIGVLPGSPVLPSTASLVVSLGIEFYRVINSGDQRMASGNAMRVIAVV